MASAVVINKTNGSIVRKLSLTTRLEDVNLTPNEVLSWNEEFRSAAPEFDWQSRIMQHGNAVANVHCTKGCTITVDHVDVRIEGDNAADVCALIREVYELLGGSHNPLRDLWSDPIAWLRKNFSLSRLRGFGETGLAFLYAAALVVVIAQAYLGKWPLDE